MTILQWLERKYPRAKKTTLRRMLEEGRVSRAGQVICRAREDVGMGLGLQVDEKPRNRGPESTLEPLALVHEDADVMVVNKPAGLLTSTVPNEKRPTAIAIIRRYVTEREPRARVGVIHRLDMDASGLLVFSKNNEAFENLKRQFYRHTVERVYLAVVQGKLEPPAGRIESNLVEMPDGSVFTTRQSGKGDQAITHYETIRQLKGHSLVRVKLETGRKHQIRTHLAQRGCPIVGDSVYGEARATDPLLLAAVLLVFDHPTTGQRMRFEIDPPPQIRLAARG